MGPDNNSVNFKHACLFLFIQSCSSSNRMNAGKIYNSNPNSTKRQKLDWVAPVDNKVHKEKNGAPKQWWLGGSVSNDDIFSISTDLALWAGLVIESRCPPVLCVCVYVCHKSCNCRLRTTGQTVKHFFFFFFINGVDMYGFKDSRSRRTSTLLDQWKSFNNFNDVFHPWLIRDFLDLELVYCWN